MNTAIFNSQVDGRFQADTMNHFGFETPEINAKLSQMHRHPVFSMVTDLARLRTFMEWHVFAVWDFMSLVKRLQNDFTCECVPWLPPSNRRAARFINEIVLGEESDESPDGSYDSHFGLYIAAMHEIGASTTMVEKFIALLRDGTSVNTALAIVNAPDSVANFVRFTVDTALRSETHEVLGCFFFGREYSIPKMFSSLLESWTVDPALAPTFVYYLERHITLDGESHGPAVKAIIDQVLADDVEVTREFQAASIESVERRISLWDGLYAYWNV
jgi:hypothetical protein